MGNFSKADKFWVNVVPPIKKPTRPFDRKQQLKEPKKPKDDRLPIGKANKLLGSK